MSSMMQPSQESGHLQSPVKKSIRKKRDEKNKPEGNYVVITISNKAAEGLENQIHD